MEITNLSRIAALILLLVLGSVSAAAQESEESAPAEEVEFNPNIAIEELELRVVPMGVEELEAQFQAWIAEITDKSKKISENRIDQIEADGTARTELVTKATALGAEQDALVARANVVLAALEAKGSDVEAHRKLLKGTTSFSTNLFDPTVLHAWLLSSEGGLKWILAIVWFIVILIGFWILSRILAGVTRKAMNRVKHTSDLLKSFFVNTVRKVTFLVGFVIALGQLGVDIGPLLAAIGVVGFVIGFALQGTLSNFACGIMILLYRPFDVGDAVDVAGVAGTVEAMTLVSTTIKSFDNQKIIVPNNSIWGGIITNITGNDTRRVDMVFGIGYDDDIAKAQGILEDILSKSDLILDNPAFVIKLHELADSSVNFIVRPWAKTSDYWNVYWEVTRAVKERFDAEGISIPYPQQDVHMHQVSPA